MAAKGLDLSDPDAPLVQAGLDLAVSIYPTLRGHTPEVTGVCLADLVSTFFAGFHPDMREETIRLWLLCMRGLIPPNEERLKDMYHSDKPWERPGGIN